ncbi:MAG: hypothetical protein ACI4I6_06120 [Hominimerdicola sp.]
MEMLKNGRNSAQAGDYSFFYSSATFSCGGVNTEILTAANGYSRAYAGKKPVLITLTGRLLPAEKEYFLEMINSLSEGTFSLELGTMTFNECVLSYGEEKFSENGYLGDFKMIFKEINQ